MSADENSQTNRKEVRYLRRAIVLAMCVSALGILVVSAYVLVQTSLNTVFASKGEETATDNAELFEEVVGVSPEKFGEIRSYLDTSIDVTFYCRFTFSDLADLEPIIATNKLTLREKQPRFLISFGILGAQYPEWYDLKYIPEDSLAYHSDKSNARGTLMWLYINLQDGVAYVETLD